MKGRHREYTFFLNMYFLPAGLSQLELHLDPDFQPQKKVNLIWLQCSLFLLTKNGSFFGSSKFGHWCSHQISNYGEVVPKILSAFRSAAAPTEGGN